MSAAIVVGSRVVERAYPNSGSGVVVGFSPDGAGYYVAFSNGTQVLFLYNYEVILKESLTH